MTRPLIPANPSFSLCALLVLATAACGAREVQPVPERSALDDRLSCEHIQGEQAANVARIAELGAEAERRGRDSVGMILLTGLAGAVFLDGGESQRREAEALGLRNARLRDLSRERNCPPA